MRVTSTVSPVCSTPEVTHVASPTEFTVTVNPPAGSASNRNPPSPPETVSCPPGATLPESCTFAPTTSAPLLSFTTPIRLPVAGPSSEATSLGASGKSSTEATRVPCASPASGINPSTNQTSKPRGPTRLERRPHTLRNARKCDPYTIHSKNPFKIQPSSGLALHHPSRQQPPSLMPRPNRAEKT